MPVICPTCQIFRQKARSADFTRNDPVASRELRFGFDNWTLRYTDTRVSLDSQLTDPSARTFVVAASPLSPLSPLHLVDPGECMGHGLVPSSRRKVVERQVELDGRALRFV
jgi:hypothetical protein